MNAARAAERHATGVAASADGRPAAAVRHLRIAFRQAAAASDRELQARILVSLAWAEAERGETDGRLPDCLTRPSRCARPSSEAFCSGSEGYCFGALARTMPRLRSTTRPSPAWTSELRRKIWPRLSLIGRSRIWLRLGSARPAETSSDRP